MSTAIQRRQPLDPAILHNLAEVSSSATEAFAVASMSAGNVASALEVAGAIEELRAMFDRPEIQQRVEALRDTAIGFRTDKDPRVWNKKLNNGSGGYQTPYPYPVVKDCAIEATLRGLQLVGNQFNIISQRCYCTKEGFEYLIKRRKEITNFIPIIGIPQMRNGGVLIECEAKWENAGTPQQIKVTIPVKSDEYGTADQYIGKATRKLLKRCYEIMTGNVIPEGDANEAEPSVEVIQQTALPPAQVEPSKAPRVPRLPKPSEAAQVTPPPEKAQVQPAPVTPPTAHPDAPQQAATPEQASGVDAGDGKEQEVTPSNAVIVASMLSERGVLEDDFWGWLRTTGRVKDTAMFDTVADLPAVVLAELVANDFDALKKCIRIYGA